MNREELVQKILDKMENIFDNDIALSEQIADIAEQYAKKLEGKIDLSGILTNFQIFLNDKKLINNHDWDYEKEAKAFIKKYKLLPTPPQKQ